MVVITSARYAERGTVRAGLLTSPLGINATSIPTKANINKTTASPNGLLPGQPDQPRFCGLRKKIPTQMNRSKGRSLEILIDVTSTENSSTTRLVSSKRTRYTQNIT